jgi:flagellar hook-length control protein FliK
MVAKSGASPPEQKTVDGAGDLAMTSGVDGGERTHSRSVTDGASRAGAGAQRGAPTAGAQDGGAAPAAAISELGQPVAVGSAGARGSDVPGNHEAGDGDQQESSTAAGARMGARGPHKLGHEHGMDGGRVSSGEVVSGSPESGGMRGGGVEGTGQTGMSAAASVTHARDPMTATPGASERHGSVARPANEAAEPMKEHGVVRLRDEAGTMRLEMRPEGLGPLEVRIAVRQNGVHASIAAQHDEARQLLNAQRGELEAALLRSDLRLASFNVDVGGRHARFLMGEDGSHGGAGAAPPVLASGAARMPDAEAPVRPARSWVRGGGLSLRV